MSHSSYDLYIMIFFHSKFIFLHAGCECIRGKEKLVGLSCTSNWQVAPSIIESISVHSLVVGLLVRLLLLLTSISSRFSALVSSWSLVGDGTVVWCILSALVTAVRVIGDGTVVWCILSALVSIMRVIGDGAVVWCILSALIGIVRVIGDGAGIRCVLSGLISNGVGSEILALLWRNFGICLVNSSHLRALLWGRDC